MDLPEPRSWRRKTIVTVALSAALLTSVAAVCILRGQRTVVHEDTTPPRLRKPNLDGSLPVVLWHGMGDSCCAPYSIGKVASYISDELGTSSQAPARACANPLDSQHAADATQNCPLLIDAADTVCTVRAVLREAVLDGATFGAIGSCVRILMRRPTACMQRRVACCVCRTPGTLHARAGVFVHSIATGEDTANDVASSYWGNVNAQVGGLLNFTFCRALYSIVESTCRALLASR